MEVTYTKLSALVNEDFTVEAVGDFKFKKWDSTTNTMLISDHFEAGYRKLYQVDTNRGRMDLSSSQLGNMLEGVCHAGSANVVGATFNVKSNGKTGIEIRYFLNAVRTTPQEIPIEDVPEFPND